MQLVTMEGCGVGGKVSVSEHSDVSAELPACSFPQSQQQSTCQSMSRDLCAACCSQPSYAMTPAHCTVAIPLASEGAVFSSSSKSLARQNMAAIEHLTGEASANSCPKNYTTQQATRATAKHAHTPTDKVLRRKNTPAVLLAPSTRPGQ